jgi:peptidoglycan/LPS O-acetylase OafA/YrhL
MVHHWTATTAFMKLMKMPYPVPSFPSWLSAPIDLGYLGVDLFFILSGIVIGRTAIGRSWQTFGEARLVRLLPAYVFATLLTLALAKMTLQHPPPLNSFWLSLTGLQWFFGFPTIIGPAWTLFNEVRFYIAVALVLVIIRNGEATQLRGAVKWWLVGLLLAPSLQLPAFSFIVQADYGVYFAFGALIGLCRGPDDLRRELPTVITAFVLAWVRLDARVGNVAYLDGIVHVVVSGLILLAVTLIAVRSRLPGQSRVPESVGKVVAFFALTTYPVYLLHEGVGMPLVGFLMASGFKFYLAVATAAVSIIALASLVVFFVEPLGRALIRASIFGKRKAAPA